MGNKIILSADSTCDLGEELGARYEINYFPLHIVLDGKQYKDGIEISPEEIYDAWRQKKLLPRTAAVNPGEYLEYFKKWTDRGYQVIHVNIGSGISSSYQNACVAAADLPGMVFPIDSQNLSTGIGLLVIEAAERIARGMEAAEIQSEVNGLVKNSQASFVIDTLEFMRAGGRCSTVEYLGANLLKIKPCIAVNNRDGGRMSLIKKYRGPLKKVLEQYTNELFDTYTNIKKDRAFVTHSGIDNEYIDMVKELVSARGGFEEIHVTRASGVISSHCGPNTLGVLFLTRD